MVIIDGNMTDFDAISARFAEAVFSGILHPIPRADEEAFVARWRLPCPGWVMAAHPGEPVAGAVELRLHPGMRYLCAARAETLAACDSVHGQPLGYEGWARFLAELREAIVSLRQAEMREPAHREISYQEEVQGQALALRELRQNGRPGPAYTAWLDLVLRRHQRHLHQLRLRFLEMLTALSSGVDGRQQMGYVIQSGLRRLLETYSLPALRQAALETTAEVAALVSLAAGPEAPESGSPLVRRALAAIHARFTEPVSLAEIAAAAHASPEHVAREFRRGTGRTVVEALQLLRINHARQLLVETDRTVLDVAFSSGFESAEHFYRTFRKLTGLTPRAYRSRHRS